jgi:hypothetical protein
VSFYFEVAEPYCISNTAVALFNFFQSAGNNSPFVESALVVCTENLNTGVVVMKSAKDGA